jgi:hypothetical protein
LAALKETSDDYDDDDVVDVAVAVGCVQKAADALMKTTATTMGTDTCMVTEICNHSWWYDLSVPLLLVLEQTDDFDFDVDNDDS